MHYLTYLAELGSTDLHAFGHGATEQLWSALLLRPGQRVLDIGCGTGQTLLRFGSRDRITIDGIDLLEEMLRVARIRLRLAGLRPNLVRADAVAIPFADRSYDAVFTESVLGIQSQDRARALLGEIFRVLRPGGRVAANEGVWKPGTPSETISRISRSCTEDFGFAPVAVDHPTVMAAIEAAGLSPVSAELLHEAERRKEDRPPEFWLSRLLTRILQVRSYLSPRLLRERRHYRRLLEKHRDDHEHFEVRLFVAVK